MRHEFDGLAKGQPLAGLSRGDEGRLGGDCAEVAGGDDGGARKYSCVRRGAVAAGVDDLSCSRSEDRADCSTARQCGLLCAGRAVSAAFDVADDGDSGAGGGSGADCGVFAEACKRDDGGGVARRSDGVLSSGRSAGDRGDGVMGRATIGRVDKVVGPGNLYVTAAKVLASSECGIDMPAGPTEIVVTSETGSAVGIAADLVAQAEHDPEALAVLITSNEVLATGGCGRGKDSSERKCDCETVAWRAGLHICNCYGS